MTSSLVPPAPLQSLLPASLVRPMTQPRSERVVNSYLLWCLFLMGFGGVHRLYNGKIFTGLLWLCTWGFFGVGQIVDVFLIPDMAEEQRLRLMMRAGVNPMMAPGTGPVVTQTIAAPTQDDLTRQILQVAKENGGRITVVQAVMATSLSFEKVEETLVALYRKGYAELENHQDSGVITYHFPGI
jgi:hypothetical protein